jgi:O-methyltransferase involved in polyketide biosynthesis
MLRGDPNTAVLTGDLRKPADVLAQAREIGLLDLEQPVALLLAGVVHFLPDEDQPDRIVAELREALVPGSYLLLSHVTSDCQPPEVLAAYELSGQTGSALHLRTRAELERYFTGLTMVEPGLVFVTTWRPDPGEELDENPERFAAYAGVGRKD